METEGKKIITRVYIDAEGNLVVTDLWEEMKEELSPFFNVEPVCEL